MHRGWGWVLLVGVAASAACDRHDTRTAAESAAAKEPAAEPASRPALGTWSPVLGDILIVPSDSSAGLVVYPENPDAAMVSAAPIVLLGPGGDTLAASVGITLDDTLLCGDAPVAHLAGAPGGWSIGMRGGAARPIRSDSMEAFPPADSVRVVADLARLASTITGSRQSRFTGLPFAVLGARRFSMGNVQVVVAHLVRRVPQEAAPLEEHTLLIAERDRPNAPLTAAFSQLSEGTEETAQYFDAIGVLRAGDTALLVLARDASARTEYQILERPSAGTWRIRWTRPVSC